MREIYKILHINADNQVNYFIFQKGVRIRSTIPETMTGPFIKNTEFDLILSEKGGVTMMEGFNPAPGA